MTTRKFTKRDANRINNLLNATSAHMKNNNWMVTTDPCFVENGQLVRLDGVYLRFATISGDGDSKNLMELDRYIRRKYRPERHFIKEMFGDHLRDIYLYKLI